MSAFLYHMVFGYGLVVGAAALTIGAISWFKRHPVPATAFVLPSMPAILISALYGTGLINLAYSLAEFAAGTRYLLGAVLVGGVVVIFLASLIVVKPGQGPTPLSGTGVPPLAPS